MKLAMLGSGSQGNSTLLISQRTRILVDAGFSGKQVAERMATLRLDVADLDAIVITHEHGDHTRGMGVLARRFGIPLYLSPGTREATASLLRGEETIREYIPGRSFQIGDLQLDPFLTVHDAVDPVAVTVTDLDSGRRVGVATDLGRPTAGIRHSLAGCDFLILESNHDESLLRSGPYPPSVQARIASSHGHLSNHAAAAFVRELIHPGLTGVLLAHLSAECNRPELALEVVGRALRGAGWKGYLGVAPQHAPTPLLELARLDSAEEVGQLQLF